MSKSALPLVLQTDHLAPPDAAGGMWENRAAAYRIYDDDAVPKCTVAVTAYNRLEKTKTCVECILAHTKNIDYELLLIDNGSDDGTLAYFESVKHKPKKVVRITKNIGFGFAWHAAKNHFSGKYLVIVANDVYVTQNWLANLLACYESDPRIGYAAPVSSNVSNLQQVDLVYDDWEEMQAQAAAYNQRDPRKWEERIRCISLIGIYSRLVLDTVGLNDPAFLHDFTEDDLALRLRRAGYRLMLCRDTWVCHDHDFKHFTPEQLEAYHIRADSGRAVFREKYPGLDAWADMLNFEGELLATLDTHPFGREPLTVLIADPRCGTPVLEVRNRLRRREFPRPDINAFTTHAKYFTDLLTVADAVACDRLENIDAYYPGDHFDVIILCDPINDSPDPFGLMQKVSRLLKNNGLLLYKLRNSDNQDSVLHTIKKEG